MAKQKFKFLAIPCDRKFVLNPDKAKEFNNLKSKPTRSIKTNISTNLFETTVIEDIRPALKKLCKRI